MSLAGVKVGWAGLGKLGLPCALVLAQHHEVTGYDVSEQPWKILDGAVAGHREESLAELIASGKHVVRAHSIAELVAASDVVFAAVQTPHAPAYGGEQPMPGERRDFEYAYLVQACRDICTAALDQRRHITLAVVSTVLPGTTGRLIRPLLNPYVRLVYTPQFIAMGTTIADFRNPEFVICGTDGDAAAAGEVREVFRPVHGNDRLFCCSIETAEAVKVLYNTFISVKVAWANAVMELCHKTGADCDVVVDALSGATDRIISPKYLRGGMGDSGACHPRDLAAMSWLAQRLGLSYDLFGEMAKAREAQARWLAGLIDGQRELTGLPAVMLGRSYKPGSDLTAGSAALLTGSFLDGPVSAYDPYSGPPLPPALFRAVYAVTARHDDWLELSFPAGSVVIDPFGYIGDQPGVTVIRVGRKT